MPSASDELRATMRKRFGDDVSDAEPVAFLREAGYTLNFRWHWVKFGVNELKDMTRDEFDCLLFLVHEYDYGSLEIGNSDAT